MKKLFPLLVAYIFLTTQSWALSGGPVFGDGLAGAGTGTTTGTYAGAMIPQGDDDGGGDVGSGVDGGDASNSLGVFTLGIPLTSLASGSFVYFTQGRTYVGTIIGIADPDTLSFRGLVKSQFNIDTRSALVNLTTGVVTPIVTSVPGGFANGSVECSILPGIGGFSVGSSSGAIGGTIRIQGTARLTVLGVDNDDPIQSLILTVDGYKQSSTADLSADLNSFGLSQVSTSTGAVQ